MLNQDGRSRADAELLKSPVTLDCLDQCMVEELYKMVRTHDRLQYWSALFTVSGYVHTYKRIYTRTTQCHFLIDNEFTYVEIWNRMFLW